MGYKRATALATTTVHQKSREREMDRWTRTTHCLDLLREKKVLQAMGHGERMRLRTQAPIIKSTRPTYRQIMLNVFGDSSHDKGGRMVTSWPSGRPDAGAGGARAAAAACYSSGTL